MGIFDKIKDILIQKFLEHLKKAPTATPINFLTFTLSIDKIDLKQYTQYLNSYPLAYWQNIDKTFDFLAIGQVHAINKMHKLIRGIELMEENPDLFLVGGRRFDLESKIANEWNAFGPCYFFIPQILISNKGNHQSKVSLFYPQEILKDRNKKRDFIQKLESNLFIEKKVLSSGPFERVVETPGPNNWKVIINNCLNDLNEDSFSKVVLSRKKIYSSTRPLGPSNHLSHYLTKRSKGNIFYLRPSIDSAFLSFSPERLFLLKDNELLMDSLAGTRKRGKDSLEDHKMALELQTSPKELLEHRIVTREIQKRMQDLCSETYIQQTEKILKLQHVQHLHTIIKGKIKKDIKVTEVLGRLHPTPAVGGYPRQKSFDYIRNIEPFDRGFYAAPVGYISKNISEFLVGIRSALFIGPEMHLFAGAGIVKESQYDKEWQETKIKMKIFDHEWTRDKDIGNFAQVY